jgi:menaquinone-dependent protoporphyrinogen IX oxidase
MNKIAVIYYSKHGATKMYAEKLAEAVGADLFDAHDVKYADIRDYDVIVYGGGIYSGGIKGIEFLKKSWRKGLSAKKVITFAVGITIDQEENRQQCREINFVKKLKDLPCYFLPGAYDPATLTGVDKKIMNFTLKLIGGGKAQGATAESEMVIERMKNGCDLRDLAVLEPLIEAVRAL